MWEGWNESKFDDPAGDESLGGRLARFIINQAPESKFFVLDDYTYAEWDDSLVCSLMREVFSHDVTLTPALLGEIRDFATQNPSDDSDVTLRMLDEYSKKRHHVAASV